MRAQRWRRGIAPVKPVMSVHSFCPKWYAIKTKPRQESRAASNLRSWGLETLAPKTLSSLASKSARGGPLFPGYLFARFDANSLLGRVRFTRGVNDVVGLGESATPVDDSIIALIRSRLDSDGIVRLRPPTAGMSVEVVSGPMQSLVGVFERELPEQDRVIILLATMGGQVHANLPKELVQAVDRHLKSPR